MQRQTIEEKKIQNLVENILNIWHQNVELARLPQHASFFFHGNLLTTSLGGKLCTLSGMSVNI
jgi:hypothetical protein